MSNALHEVLAERARRADPTTDPDAFLALVRGRAEQRHRTGRNAMAAAGGATLVAALVTGAIVLPQHEHSHAAPAAGSPASSGPAAGGLVPVSTPAAAAVAIGLVPDGWHYTGRQGPVTYYGPTTLPSSAQPDYTSVIVVDVHERIRPDGPNDLRIAGRAGRYHDDQGVHIATMLIDATTELDVQVPVSAHLTKTQALRIAATLDLRSKAEKTHG